MAREPVDATDLPGTRAAGEPGTAEPPAARATRGGTFRALRHRDFRLLWIGLVVSAVGTWMQIVAQALLVLDLSHGSALALGLVSLAQASSFLLFALFGGAIADRIDKRRLLLVTQTLCLLFAVLLGVLTLLNVVAVWMVVILAFLQGTALSFDQPARAALVPELVPPEDLWSALSLQSIVFTGASTVGPALAGFGMSVFGFAGNFFANALSYLGVLGALLAMRASRGNAVQSTPLRVAHLRAIREALATVRADAVLPALLWVFGSLLFFGPSASVLLPVMGRQILHLNAPHLGILFSAAGAGTIIGGLSLATLRDPHGKARLALMSAGLWSLALAWFAVSRSFELSFLALLALGLFQSGVGATTLTLMQTRVPPAMRGRVMSLNTLLLMGVRPLGDFAAAAVIVAIGAPATALAGAALVGVVALGVACRPAVRIGIGAALALACLLPTGAIRAAPTLAPAGTACDRLVSMTIPGVQITSAVRIPAGEFQPRSARDSVSVPEFCRITVVARPVADSEIHIEVWIPLATAWNGKFEGIGNGGYSGDFDYPAMATALQRGYAVGGHDTGHSGDDLRFGQGHPEKIIDYAWRAVHLMTATAKLLIRVQTGRFAQAAYFVGCSAGGHQALSEAQRFPLDYDGIVAGAPAANRLRMIFGLTWSWMALHPNGRPILPPSKLALLTQASVAACDGLDGLKDGLVDDPRVCHFDAAALACRDGDRSDCLNPSEVDAVRKVHAGLKDPQTGKPIFAGWHAGTEDIGDQSWRTYLLDPLEPKRTDFFRYFLFHDPNWDSRGIQWSADLAYADAQLGFLDATDPNLGPYAQHGGKLILFAGWSDPIVPAEDTVAYYEAVTAAAGGPARTLGFARLFLAPGMGHCGGGGGPRLKIGDAVEALDAWVSGHKPPDRLTAAQTTLGFVARTRPLCPYPQVARYQGSGSIDDAANFSCTLRK